ncbi:MAG TPA: glycosyltransferase family 4 protein [Acidimicrobiales bacterium]|nr:glycosyltransferase family 4 protein [Acidimicrobiales bacterium]
MRVGMVSPYSLTLPGGVQAQVLGLARAMRAEGVEVRVLGPCDGPPPDPNVTPLGNSVPTAANGSMAAIAPDPPATLRVIRALRDEAFDVVHVHEPLVPGPSLSTVIFGDAPMLATFHRAGSSGGYRSTATLSRRAMARVAVRTAVSQEAADTAADIVGGTYVVTWNGVELDAYAGPAGPAPAREPGTATVVFIGRHEQRKGLAVLLDALGRLDGRFRLQVVGEGPETARLRAATAGDRRVEWLGTVADGEKVARLRAADVLCAPSLGGESFGVVLLEALAAGTPVVASDLDGYRNAVRPGVDAVMVPPGDPVALARGLEEIAAGGPRVAAMVRSGRARAEAFSMGRLARGYLELYDVARATAPSPPPAPPRLRTTIARRSRRGARRG